MIGATCAGVTKRGVFSTKMKPSASAPASTQSRASVDVGDAADLDARHRGHPPHLPSPLGRGAQSQLADLRGDVGGADERLADQHGVGARARHALDVVAREEAALADGDVAGRDQRERAERGREVGLERLEVRGC